MAESGFSRGEMEDLVQKLSSPQFDLSARERALLLAVFSAAGEHVRGDSAANVSAYEGRTLSELEPTLSELKAEIIEAFIPGEDPEFIIVARIGIPPPPPPWPPPPDVPPLPSS